VQRTPEDSQADDEDDDTRMSPAQVGAEYTRIRRAIIDKDVIIPPKTVIGFDRVADRQRFKVTDSGLVVISKGMKLHAAVDPSG